jgi:TolA-binding protein
MEAQVISFLLVTCIGLIGVVYWIHRNEIAKLKDAKDDHEKRVQKLEDIHTIKIDQVAEKLDKLERKVEELAYNIHKEKNVENQLTQAINLLIKKIDNETK